MTRRLWLPGLVLSTLGIAVRLLVATRGEGIEVDGILYLANAAALAGDLGRFNAVHQPLYSLVLLAAGPLGGDAEWMGRVCAAVAGGLWVWPALWLARETTEAPVAWPAGLLVALMPAAAERLTSGVRAEDAPGGAVAYAWQNPAGLVRRAVVNLHLVDKDTLPGLLQSGGLVLVALGLARLRWRRAPPEWLLPVALLPLGGLLLLNVESRYFVPALPVLAIIGALGVVRLGPPRHAAGGAHLSRAGAAALVLVLLSFVPWLVRPWFREDPSAVDRTAGRWLRAEAGAGGAFLGRYPVIGYYAGARDIPLGARSLDQALAEARRQGARFLVVDSVRTPEIRPDLLPLLGGATAPRGELRLATTIEDRAGRRVLIYRILPVGGAA